MVWNCAQFMAAKVGPLHFATGVLLALAAGICAAPGTVQTSTHTDVTELVRDIKAFERRIGFAQTNNFLSVSKATPGFPFCGYVSRFYLPYSYEDPAIRWLQSASKEECVALAADADVYDGTSEAVGESQTPITSAMLAVPVDRLVYLVIHEDCHEQFALPQGIEEPLCEVIVEHAMMDFAAARFATMPDEYSAIRSYARRGTDRWGIVKAFYLELAALYERYQRGDIAPQQLLRERVLLFSEAAGALAWEKGGMNNVAIASLMTYSRHYPFFAHVFRLLESDVGRMVRFLKRVDAAKPSAEEVAKRNNISGGGVEFIRAYETAIVEDVKATLSRDAQARPLP
jgi:predicted aminopeptidase